MRTVSIELLTELEKKNRYPILLLEVSIINNEYYMSDLEIPIQGTGGDIVYKPWIESWGGIREETDYLNIISNGGLEARSCTITMVKTKETEVFIKDLFDHGKENIEVTLKRIADGMNWEFADTIDVLIIQPPFNIDSAKMTFCFDLVSKIMATNKRLNTPPEGEPVLDIVVGTQHDIVLTDRKEEWITTLTEPMSRNFVGKFAVGNTIGSPEPPFNIWINEEVMRVSEKTDASLTVTLRDSLTIGSQNSHAAGSPIYVYGLYGPYFKYNVCAGPVQGLSNLRVVGADDNNATTEYQHLTDDFHAVFHPELNPAQVWSYRRPLWLTTKETDPDPLELRRIEQLYGMNVQTRTLGGAPEILFPEAVNSEKSSVAVLSIPSTDSGGKAFIKFLPGTPITNNLDADPFSNGIYGFAAGTSETQFRWGYIKGAGSPPSYYYPPDGEIASATYSGPADLSYLGTTTKIEIEIFYRHVTAKGADVKVEVIFIDSSSVEHVLETFYNNNLSDYTFASTIRDTDKYLYDVTSLVSSFADLALCDVKIQVTNTALSLNDGAAAAVEIWSIQYICAYTDEPTGGFLQQEIVSHFGQSLNEGSVSRIVVSVLYDVDFKWSNGTCSIDFIRRDTSDYNDNITIDTLTYSDPARGEIYRYEYGDTSTVTLANLRFGLIHTLTGPTEAVDKESIIHIREIVWEIDYELDPLYVPPELFVQLADKVVVDVAGDGGADITPPEAINEFIPLIFTESHLNDVKTVYQNNNYYLNGMLPGDITQHEAVRKILLQGMGRLLHDAGKTEYIPYFEENISQPVISVDLVRGGVGTIRGLGVQMVQDFMGGLKNEVTINTDYSPLLGVYQAKSINSVTPPGHQDTMPEERDYELIGNSSIGNLISQRLLGIMSGSQDQYTIHTLLDTSYVLQKGDRIGFSDPLGYARIGEILSINHSFESPKNNKSCSYDISIINATEYLIGDFVGTGNTPTELFMLLEASNITTATAYYGDGTREVISGDTFFEFSKSFGVPPAGEKITLSCSDPALIEYIDIYDTYLRGAFSDLSKYVNLIGFYADTCEIGNLDWITGHQALSELYTPGCNLSGFLDLSGIENLLFVDLSDNNYTSINRGITTSGSSSLSDFDISGNDLEQSSVDLLLTSMDNSLVSFCTINISGGTNATPGEDGLAAKTNLEGRGCTVLVN